VIIGGLRDPRVSGPHIVFDVDRRLAPYAAVDLVRLTPDMIRGVWRRGNHYLIDYRESSLVWRTLASLDYADFKPVEALDVDGVVVWRGRTPATLPHYPDPPSPEELAEWGLITRYNVLPVVERLGYAPIKRADGTRTLALNPPLKFLHFDRRNQTVSLVLDDGDGEKHFTLKPVGRRGLHAISVPLVYSFDIVENEARYTAEDLGSFYGGSALFLPCACFEDGRPLPWNDMRVLAYPVNLNGDHAKITLPHIQPDIIRVPLEVYALLSLRPLVYDHENEEAYFANVKTRYGVIEIQVENASAVRSTRAPSTHYHLLS